jgi:hypothetical protein
MNTREELIVQGVRERGYLDGWTKEKLAGRQVAKYIEELFELADNLSNAPQVMLMAIWWLKEAATYARQAFDAGDCGYLEFNIQTRKEITDLCVVQTVLESQDSEVDYLDLAVQKSQKDVSRGIRSV